MNKKLLISIIIPIYNDNKGLKACLQAISKQKTCLLQIEVIVVDNASTVSPEELVKQFSFAKYSYEKKPGSYAARNKGISIARGEYFVFLDADCTPATDWLEKGIKCLNNYSDNVIVGGGVEFILSTRPTATELYQYIVGFQQKENIEDKQFSATANIFISKKNALKIGLFEENLLSGGDRNWCWSAFEIGIQLTYCPAAIVTTAPRRLLKNAIKQTRRVAGGRFHAKKLSFNKNHAVTTKLKPHRTNWQSIIWILKHPKLSYVKRFQVLSIAIVLKFVALFEPWRLRFGAKAERY